MALVSTMPAKGQEAKVYDIPDAELSKFQTKSKDLVPGIFPAGISGARSVWLFARTSNHFLPPAYRPKLGRSSFRLGGRLLFVSVLSVPLRNRIKNGFDLKGSQIGPRFQHQRDNAGDVRTSKAVSG